MSVHVDTAINRTRLEVTLLERQLFQESLAWTHGYFHIINAILLAFTDTAELKNNINIIKFRLEQNLFQ